MSNEREYWIRLPFPPSLNSIMGMRRPDKYWMMIKERAAQVAFSLADGRPMTGGVAIRYFYKKNDLRRFDIENCSKVCCDGFTEGGLWTDDYQIDDSHCTRMPINPGAGYVDIHIREISSISQFDQCSAKWDGVKRDGYGMDWLIDRPKKRKSISKIVKQTNGGDK